MIMAPFLHLVGILYNSNTMKHTSTRLVLFLLLFALSRAGHAQKTPYYITSNTNTSIYGSGVICTNCDIYISPGVTVTVNSTCSCGNCGFYGGSFVVQSGSSFTLSGLDSFINESVIFNEAVTSQNLVFYGDTVAFSKAMSLTSAPTTIDSSRVSINQATTFNTTTFAKDSIHVNANLTTQNASSTISNSNMTIATATTTSINTGTFEKSYVSLAGTATFKGNNSLTIDSSTFYLGGTTANVTDGGTTTITGNSNVILAGSTNTFSANNLGTVVNSSISMTGNTKFTATNLVMTGGSLSETGNAALGKVNNLSFTGTAVSLNGNATLTAATSTSNLTGGSTLMMNGNSSLTLDNGFDINNSNVTLYANAFIATTGGNLKVENNSYVTVGDGSSTSYAYLRSHSAMSVLTGSTVAIAHSNNNYHADAGSVAGNTFNCGAGYPNACAAAYEYGCATITPSGTLACVTLAVADIRLSAMLTGPGQITLNWTDEQAATAAQYLVQRNNGNDQWTTIATISAGGYTTGEYSYTDADAPAGSIDYRIERMAQDGQTLYSPISSITIAAANTSNLVGIHPNPAIGGNVYITTPNTSELIVNVYTITGQLLMRTQLKGQTQYPVRLPSQASSLSTVVVQVIGQSGTQTFTVLVR